MKTAVLAALLAAVLSGAAAFAVAWGFRPAPAAAPAEASLEALRAALQDTCRELAALRGRMGDRGAAAATAAPSGPAAGGSRALSGPAPEAGAEAGAVPAAPGADAAPAAPGNDAAEVAARAMLDAVRRNAEQDEEPESRIQEREDAVRKPAAALERFRDMRGWDHAVDARQRWMLTPEGDLVAMLGKPDEVVVGNGGEESWIYRVPNGDTDDKGRADWDDITLEIHNGRLVRVSD